ncbi:proteinase-activated receptor 2-like [Latimeria chalumnae]|uniref:G-protein coupled receptors family 1 profile domain-containing protein n=1 Tax=Latimeria chalumnae TaxID=7897 RepID=M3XGL5_LATCH|nr:PREDICTED: proteinase-activated receptor 2-like [Latimeria chalumnae]|eukprot:XP_005992684.1 PREDICTED: proteinase-activated receptor 2-like [Latimeria chalumnae]
MCIIRANFRMRNLKFWLLFLLCLTVEGVLSGSAKKNSKGFIAEDKDSIEESVLTGGLTTVFLPLVYIIIFITGLPANGIALWVFLFRTEKKHPAVIYMANLALADLLFIIWFPLKIAYHINGNNWIYGDGLCKVLVGFFYGNMYCSILFITCLSVQRYWVVVDPLSQTKRKTGIAFGISIAIWIIVSLGTIPLYLVDQTVPRPNLNITTCHDVLPRDVLTNNLFSYFLSLAIGVFFFPAVLTTVVYVLMIRVLSSSVTEEHVGKQRRRAIKLIVVVLVLYLVCFAPSNILLVVHYSLIKYKAYSNVYAGYITVLCLSSLNSCIDPFIYYFVSKDFRDHVKNALICRSVRTVKRMQVSFTSLKYSKRSNIYTSSSGSTSNTNC